MRSVVSLLQPICLTKEGKDDIVYPADYLFKVAFTSGTRLVLQDDNNFTFQVDLKSQDVLWEFI